MSKDEPYVEISFLYQDYYTFKDFYADEGTKGTMDDGERIIGDNLLDGKLSLFSPIFLALVYKMAQMYGITGMTLADMNGYNCGYRELYMYLAKELGVKEGSIEIKAIETCKHEGYTPIILCGVYPPSNKNGFKETAGLSIMGVKKK